MTKSLKLDSDLWKRVEQHAAKQGYSSPEEFVRHLIEQELARAQHGHVKQVEADNEADRQLRGLGYLK